MPTHDEVLNILNTTYVNNQWNFFFPDKQTVLYENFQWFDSPETKPMPHDLGF